MKVNFIIILFFFGTITASASIRDEIKSLHNPNGINGDVVTYSSALTVEKKHSVKGIQLSNGQKINLSQWKIVLFMQGSCPYCHQFDPMLKSLSERIGLSVFTYTIDGQGDVSYPNALPAPPEVLRTFFPNIPIATPTTFLVNVNTLEAWPLLQGAADENMFLARLDTVFQMVVSPNEK